MSVSKDSAKADRHPLTSIDLLTNHVLDGAFVRISHRLLLDGATAVIKALRLIHCALERVSLPSKHVIGVGTIAVAFEAPHEWIGSTCWPHAVELARIPVEI